MKAVRNIPKNKQDILNRDKEICTSIDVAISGNTNVMKEEDEKILR